MDSIRVTSVKDGKEIVVHELWQDRKVVLLLLRHFYCQLCHAHAVQINRAADALKKCDPPVTLIAIGVGDVAMAKSFQERTKFDGELYCDASLLENESSTSKLYETFGCLNGKNILFANPGDTVPMPEVTAAVKEANEMGFQNHDQWKTFNNNVLFQVGGTFVLGPGDTCDYSHHAKYAGDNPPPGELMRAAVGRELLSEEEYIYPSTKHWASILDMSTLKTKAGSFVGDQFTSDHQLHQLDSVQKSSVQEVTTTAAKKQKAPVATTITTSPSASKCPVHFLFPSTIWSALNDKNSDVSLRFAAASAIILPLTYSTKFFFGRHIALYVFAGLVVQMILLFKTGPADQVIKEVCNEYSVSLFTPKEMDAKLINDESCQDCSFLQQINVTQMTKDEDVRNVAPAATFEDGEDSVISDDKAFSQTLCYLREFLAKPHPLVGRKGPTCPFMPGALRKNSIYLGVVHTNETLNIPSSFEYQKSIVQKAARSFIARYKTLEPTNEKQAQHKAVVLIFPDIPMELAKAIIDQSQLDLKPEFVAEGLMIGEFHKLNNAPGLRNENFFPLRTPLPCLAIRKIVPSDLAFLSPEKYPPALRVKFLTAYLKQFDSNDKVPPSLLENLKSAQQHLDQAKELAINCKHSTDLRHNFGPSFLTNFCRQRKNFEQRYAHKLKTSSAQRRTSVNLKGLQSILF